MPSFRQALQKNAVFYLGCLRTMETMFHDEKEPDDRAASLLGFRLEQEQILGILGRLEQIYRLTEDAQIAQMYLAYLDAGTEILARGLPLVEQKRLYETGVFLSSHIEEQRAEFIYLNNLALVIAELGDVPGAVNLHLRRQSIAEKMAQPRLIVQSLDALGQAYIQTNQLDLALDCYKKVFPLAGDIGALDVLARAIGNTGLIWHKQGLFSFALDAYRDALRLAQEQKDRRSECSAHTHLGDLYMDFRKFSKAKTHYEAAFQFAKQEVDVEMAIPILNGLGSSCFGLRWYEKARQYFEQVLQIASQDNRQIQQVVALGNLGGIFFQFCQFETAREYYQKQLSLAVSINVKEFIAAVHINLGSVDLCTNHRNAASEHLQMAEQLYGEVDLPRPPQLISGLLISNLSPFVYALYYAAANLRAHICRLFPLNQNG